MRCDSTYDAATSVVPGRYSLFGTDQYPGDSIRDLGPSPTEAQLRAIAAGCVFLRCNESGGFDCAGGFRCDLDAADPSTSGCAPVPCGELGRCSDDRFICETTSEKARLPGEDPHGCVPKNCEEGYPCQAPAFCDFSRPGDANGCAYRRCDEPGGECSAGMTCLPGDSRAGGTGCVTPASAGSGGANMGGESNMGGGGAGNSTVAGAGGALPISVAGAWNAGAPNISEPVPASVGVCR